MRSTWNSAESVIGREMRHIIHHSRKSMEYLAQLHGLSIQKVEYNSNNSQFIRSFLYMKGAISDSVFTQVLGDLDEQGNGSI